MDRNMEVENSSVPYTMLYNRGHIPGYIGQSQTSDLFPVSTGEGQMFKGENKAMVSTVQASYRELPDEHYTHYEGGEESVHKHPGPLSRMVTLTHPFNPFTQQSAYYNICAQHTTSYRKDSDE